MGTFGRTGFVRLLTWFWCLAFFLTGDFLWASAEKNCQLFLDAASVQMESGSVWHSPFLLRAAADGHTFAVLDPQAPYNLRVEAPARTETLSFSAAILAFDISSDGEQLVVATAADELVFYIIDGRGASWRGTVTLERVRFVRYSDTGKTVAVAQRSVNEEVPHKTHLSVLDLQSEALLPVGTVKEAECLSMVFRNEVLTAVFQRMGFAQVPATNYTLVKAWEVRTGTEVGTFRHSSRALGLSRDGRILFLASAPQRAPGSELWRVRTVPLFSTESH